MTAVMKPESLNGTTALTTTGSAADLLKLAIERGTPVAELKELAAIYQQMSEMDSVQQFNTALAAFRAECPMIHRGSTGKITSERSGTGFSFTYAARDEIAKVVDPILGKHGFSYRWDTKYDKDFYTATCVLSHIGGHSVSSSFTVPTESKAGMSPQQKFAAAASFAERRSLSNVLGITTTDDTPDTEDANPALLTDDQVMEIEDAIKEIGVNEIRFLKYMGADSVKKIRAKDYDMALVALGNYRTAKIKKALDAQESAQ